MYTHTHTHTHTLLYLQFGILLLFCSKKGEARKETDRLCSDDQTWGKDGKAERKLKELKHEGHIALEK
jgi:hypothetical protein